MRILVFPVMLVFSVSFLPSANQRCLWLESSSLQQASLTDMLLKSPKWHPNGLSAKHLAIITLVTGTYCMVVHTIQPSSWIYFYLAKYKRKCYCYATLSSPWMIYINSSSLSALSQTTQRKLSKCFLSLHVT